VHPDEDVFCHCPDCTQGLVPRRHGEDTRGNAAGCLEIHVCDQLCRFVIE